MVINLLIEKLIVLQLVMLRGHGETKRPVRKIFTPFATYGRNYEIY
jgi:hypothetical protein